MFLSDRIQRALERAPGLVFVDGSFRHRWTLQNPSPPPVQSPPPGLNYGPAPPVPAPPPPHPPPYHLGSEDCIPLPTLASAGIDTGRESVTNAHSEERASCLFVRRILDTMLPAAHCFSSVGYPSPPPPPPNDGIKSATDAIKSNIDRQVSGERGGANGGFYNRPQDPDDVEAATRAQDALISVRAQIKEIGEANPILRSILDGAVRELEDTAASKEGVTPTHKSTGPGYMGRRLLVRREYVHSISKALSTHPVQGAVGVHGIPGVTQLSCEALCEAATRDDDTQTTRTDACHAYAFRRDHPFSRTDLSGHCWLLQNAGACKSEVCSRCIRTLTPTAPLQRSENKPLWLGNFASNDVRKAAQLFWEGFVASILLHGPINELADFLLRLAKILNTDAPNEEDHAARSVADAVDKAEFFHVAATLVDPLPIGPGVRNALCGVHVVAIGVHVGNTGTTIVSFVCLFVDQLDDERDEVAPVVVVRFNADAAHDVVQLADLAPHPRAFHVRVGFDIGDDLVNGERLVVVCRRLAVVFGHLVVAMHRVVVVLLLIRGGGR